VCDLETSRMGAPYIYDISRLRVNACVILNNEHLLCSMHVQLNCVFWICHIWKLYNAKENATLIIMHDTTFSDHTGVGVWWHLWIVFCTKNWLNGIWISGQTHLFYNFMNKLHWIPWKPEKFPSSFPMLRCAPYSVTLSLIAIHWKLQ